MKWFKIVLDVWVLVYATAMFFGTLFAHWQTEWWMVAVLWLNMVATSLLYLTKDAEENYEQRNSHRLSR